MTSRRDKEVEYMKSREKRVEDYEEQLQHLRVQGSEEYNQVKIKLETDVQVGLQKNQIMKIECNEGCITLLVPYMDVQSEPDLNDLHIKPKGVLGCLGFSG